MLIVKTQRIRKSINWKNNEKPCCSNFSTMERNQQPLLLPFVHASASTSSFLPSLFFHTCLLPSVHLMNNPSICLTVRPLADRMMLSVWVAPLSYFSDGLTKQTLFDRSGFLRKANGFTGIFVIQFVIHLWYTMIPCSGIHFTVPSLSLSLSIYIDIDIYIKYNIEHYNHYENYMSDIFVILTPSNLLMWGSWRIVPACRNFYSEIMTVEYIASNHM